VNPLNSLNAFGDPGKGPISVEMCKKIVKSQLS